LRDAVWRRDAAPHANKPEDQGDAAHRGEPWPVEHLRPQEQQKNHTAHDDAGGEHSLLDQEIAEEPPPTAPDQIIKSACSSQDPPSFPAAERPPSAAGPGHIIPFSFCTSPSKNSIGGESGAALHHLNNMQECTFILYCLGRC
jgi:hypothetical protein